MPTAYATPLTRCEQAYDRSKHKRASNNLFARAYIHVRVQYRYAPVSPPLGKILATSLYILGRPGRSSAHWSGSCAPGGMVRLQWNMVHSPKW